MRESAPEVPAPQAPTSMNHHADASAINTKMKLGDLHLQRGEYDDAITAYQEGLKLDPSNRELRQKLQLTIKTCKQENAILGVTFKCGAQ